MEKACYSNTFISHAFLFIAMEIIAVSSTIGEKKKGNAYFWVSNGS